MQAFSVGTCIGDALEALALARRSLLLVLAAAAPLIAVAIHVLAGGLRVPGDATLLAGVALLPVVDLLIATFVTVGVVAELYDRPRPVGRLLVAALRRLLSAAAAMFLVYLVVLALGVGCSMPLFDQPLRELDLTLGLGLFALWMLLSALLYTRWLVAIPASVIEYRGPVSALRRSDRLTRGHRLALFAILALFGTIAGGAMAVLEVNLGDRPDADALLFAIALLLWIPLSTIRAAISATAYAQLRAATEAGDPERLGDVFA